MRRKKRIQKSHLGLKILDLIFVLIFLIIIFSFTVGIIIRGQHDTSILENRSLTKFEHFSIKKFLERSFQNNIENTLSDQMVLGQSIKKKVNSIEATYSSSLQRKIVKLINNNYNDYIPISKDIYYYGESNYMLNRPSKLEQNKNQIKKIGKQYSNHFNNLDSYLFLITNSSIIDFNDISTSEIAYKDYIANSFNTFKFDYLDIPDFNTYKEYFYETDHHWNYKGSNYGYNKIINLLGISDESLTPYKTKTYDFNFYGSYARMTSIFTNNEKFTVYKYNLPPHTITIDGKKDIYGKEQQYDLGIYSNDLSTNHYGEYYGMDFGLIEYDYNQPQKENLLVISNSYSNSINGLLASHFNKTFFVDLRYYKNFQPEKFIQEHDINKFLLLISPDYLINDKFALEN